MMRWICIAVMVMVVMMMLLERNMVIVCEDGIETSCVFKDHSRCKSTIVPGRHKTQDIPPNYDQMTTPILDPMTFMKITVMLNHSIPDVIGLQLKLEMQHNIDQNDQGRTMVLVTQSNGDDLWYQCCQIDTSGDIKHSNSKDGTSLLVPIHPDHTSYHIVLSHFDDGDVLMTSTHYLVNTPKVSIKSGVSGWPLPVIAMTTNDNKVIFSISAPNAYGNLISYYTSLIGCESSTSTEQEDYDVESTKTYGSEDWGMGDCVINLDGYSEKTSKDDHQAIWNVPDGKYQLWVDSTQTEKKTGWAKYPVTIRTPTFANPGKESSFWIVILWKAYDPDQHIELPTPVFKKALEVTGKNLLESDKDGPAIIIVGCVFGGVVFMVILAITVLLWKKLKKTTSGLSQTSSEPPSHDSYSEIRHGGICGNTLYNLIVGQGEEQNHEDGASGGENVNSERPLHQTFYNSNSARVVHADFTTCQSHRLENCIHNDSSNPIQLQLHQYRPIRLPDSNITHVGSLESLLQSNNTDLRPRSTDSQSECITIASATL